MFLSSVEILSSLESMHRVDQQCCPGKNKQTESLIMDKKTEKSYMKNTKGLTRYYMSAQCLPNFPKFYPMLFVVKSRMFFRHVLAKSLLIPAIHMKFKVISHKLNVCMAGITSDLAKKYGDHPCDFHLDNIAGPHGTFFRTIVKIGYLKKTDQSM